MFFYIAQYPVCWTTQIALHFTPWQTCSPGTHLYSCEDRGIVERTEIPIILKW